MILKLTILFHVLGACVWTGGHIVLATTILPHALKSKDMTLLQNFENRYEYIGLPALFLQIVTGIILAYYHNPNFLAWFGLSNHVSLHLTLKFILLFLTVLFAIDAKFRVIPNLSKDTLSSLAWHIIPVTIISILFVVVGLSLRLGWK